MKRKNILLVDDEQVLRESLTRVLEKDGFCVYQTGDGRKALDLVKKVDELSVAIIDYKLPKLNGTELMKKIKEKFPQLPIIIITAFGFEGLEVKEMNHAFDYITKPFEFKRLRESVRLASLASDIISSQKEIALCDDKSYYGLIGSSALMLEVYQLIEKIADTDFTVLITGESGTGKELCARAIHLRSKRRKFPFVSVTCSAVPETLLESELFGYERGAFTGAVKEREGKFESAGSGTIFLDEIGDMSLFTQAKLLRVLQEREIERLGSNKPIQVNARVIAATNKNLPQLVREGKFREDLFYRLNVFNIKMPPLRERKEDIPILVEHFLKKYSSQGKRIKHISIEALEVLLNYSWPGNVRELENCIQRAIVMAENDILNADHLKDIGSQSVSFQPEIVFDLCLPEKIMPLDEIISHATAEIEKKLIQKALAQTGGNRTKAAQLLKISRRNLHNKLKKYNL